MNNNEGDVCSNRRRCDIIPTMSNLQVRTTEENGQVKIITLVTKNGSTGITDRLGDNDFQTNVLHTINYSRTHGTPGIDE